MIKEKNYDEYLKQQVRLGLEDEQNGNFVSVEDCFAECEEIIYKTLSDSQDAVYA
ncbi:hypothetical protein [Caviibacterium pharyngocola]|uniref:hypothetical protein n=1 Tax=Caviibacterium pharyngocola TaxID=28159 RepID=UPI0013FDE53F|nr:hypothetical protein [Caviibacterium pharyngocola]